MIQYLKVKDNIPKENTLIEKIEAYRKFLCFYIIKKLVPNKDYDIDNYNNIKIAKKYQNSFVNIYYSDLPKGVL